MSNPRGRTPKLTPEVHALIVEKVRKGLPITTAARCARINPSTLYAWIHKGEEGGPGSGPYKQFADDMHAADAAAEEKFFDVVSEAALGEGIPVQPKLALKLLQGRWAKNWGRKSEEAEAARAETDLDSSSSRELLTAGILAIIDNRRKIAALEAKINADKPSTEVVDADAEIVEPAALPSGEPENA